MSSRLWHRSNGGAFFAFGSLCPFTTYTMSKTTHSMPLMCISVPLQHSMSQSSFSVRQCLGSIIRCGGEASVSASGGQPQFRVRDVLQITRHNGELRATCGPLSLGRRFWASALYTSLSLRIPLFPRRWSRRSRWPRLPPSDDRVCAHRPLQQVQI